MTAGEQWASIRPTILKWSCLVLTVANPYQDSRRGDGKLDALEKGATMKNACRILGFWLSISTVPVAAQTIYRCENAESPVYSQQPCAPNDGDMQVIHLAPDRVPHPEDLMRAARAEQATRDRIHQRQLERFESTCVDNMTIATWQGSRQRIGRYRARITELERQARQAAGSLPGAIRETTLRSRIAQLEASIRHERNISVQTELNARTVCVQLRDQASTSP